MSSEHWPGCLYYFLARSLLRGKLSAHFRWHAFQSDVTIWRQIEHLSSKRGLIFHRTCSCVYFRHIVVKLGCKTNYDRFLTISSLYFGVTYALHEAISYWRRVTRVSRVTQLKLLLYFNWLCNACNACNTSKMYEMAQQISRNTSVTRV